ncbi:unnamed protein product [Arctia plantaginis]|uniref:Uncharacterized protein n=1 Tax=Arctia plantaginis TaxID=874455 RepID=A0A8S1AJB8_ARCPL|nr:unnamed protein product [Arctia plantaginis]
MYNANSQCKMSKRTALNENYKGLVEELPIPAEVHERDGKKYASFGSTIPIHSCSPDEIKQYANKTHHYCDVFTEQLLAPLGELVYVRLDENTAEKVFINRNKRILLVSSDGELAQWRCAPTFESPNSYMAGAPIVNKDGELVSVVTAKKGNHYAVSTFEGEGGYFDTAVPWLVLDAPEGANIYGAKTFATREQLREHVARLPPPEVSPQSPPVPVLHRGNSPRIILLAQNGRQISHQFLHGVITMDVEYL